MQKLGCQYHLFPGYSQLLRPLMLFGVLLSFALPVNSVTLDTCKRCHGDNLSGNSEIKAPNLTGQNARYLKRQLLQFKHGLRGQKADDKAGQQMAAIARTLSDQQMQQLAEQLSKFKAVVNQPQGTPSVRGKHLYETHCAACHGHDAMGKPPLTAPALRTQTKDYLVKTLNQFRHGERGADPADEYSRPMGTMSRTLKNDEQVELVVDYILSIDVKK